MCGFVRFFMILTKNKFKRKFYEKLIEHGFIGKQSRISAQNRIRLCAGRWFIRDREPNPFRSLPPFCLLFIMTILDVFVLYNCSM